MRRLYAALVCVSLLLTAVGCGTVKGLGDDISTLGRWITRSSSTNK